MARTKAPQELNPYQEKRTYVFSHILYEKNDYVATVTINRPEVLNCLNLVTLREMITAFEDTAWDDDIAVLVITGAGEKAFCTGADLREQEEFFVGNQIPITDFDRNFFGDINIGRGDVNAILHDANGLHPHAVCVQVSG